MNQPPTPIPFVTVATLTLTFRPVSGSHTDCVANIVSDTYEKAGGEMRKVNGPIPGNTSESTRTIQDMRAEAEKQLTVMHPGYAAR